VSEEDLMKGVVEMRLRRTVLLVLCLLVASAIVPVAGYAAFYNSRSMSADAWYSSWNWENGEPGPADATEDWNVSGNISGGIFRDAGAPLDVFKDTMGWASKFSYTPAAGDKPATWVEFNCFTESPSVLSFDNKLGSAKLEFLAEGTLNVWKGAEPWVQVGPDEWEVREPDESTTEMVSVMASWRATGPLTKSSYVSRERSEDFLWADRYNQSSRRAMANVSVVGASDTVYMSGTLNDAQIGEQKSNGRMNGEFPY
jgi:hypothetical protein